MPHDPNRQLQSRALQGMRAMTPLLPGIVPFGLIAGFTPVSFGFTWFDAWAGSLLMFAGASTAHGTPTSNRRRKHQRQDRWFDLDE